MTSRPAVKADISQSLMRFCQYGGDMNSLTAWRSPINVTAAERWSSDLIQAGWGQRELGALAPPSSVPGTRLFPGLLRERGSRCRDVLDYRCR